MEAGSRGSLWAGSDMRARRPSCPPVVSGVWVRVLLTPGHLGWGALSAEGSLIISGGEPRGAGIQHISLDSR